MDLNHGQLPWAPSNDLRPTVTSWETTFPWKTNYYLFQVVQRQTTKAYHRILPTMHIEHTSSSKCLRSPLTIWTGFVIGCLWCNSEIQWNYCKKIASQTCPFWFGVYNTAYLFLFLNLFFPLSHFLTWHARRCGGFTT